MAQPGIVIAFTSRCGATETFAHAAAVGVVNARTLPRLRRLIDDRDTAPPECDAAARRMLKEYVAPTEADITGSSALIVVPSAGMSPSSGPWQPFMTTLAQLASRGQLAGKRAAVIDTGDRQTTAAFATALAEHGLAIVSDTLRDARTHGRAVGTAVLGATA